jgi:transcriptional regulator with XRE-family HTH domain
MSTKKNIISEKIRALRKRRRLSQKGLAEKVGFSRSYIADIESGRTKPSRKLIEVIWAELGVSPEWLLEGKSLLEKPDGLTDQEVEDFELNRAEVSTQGLCNTLNVWSEILLDISESLYDFSFAYADIGKPNKKLLEAKEEFESILSGIKPSLDDLFRRLSKQRLREFKSPEEMMADLEEAKRKHEKNRG